MRGGEECADGRGVAGVSRMTSRSSSSYTQWCIKEAMSLCPPVFSITRKASDDLGVARPL